MPDHTFNEKQTNVDSVTRRGEDVAKQEDEAGRHNTGTQGSTERPTGTSTARDFTGIDPKEVTSDPSEDRSPAG